MANKIIVERNGRKWRRTTTKTGGMCFTISWDHFEEILQAGSFADAFPQWQLNDGEYVDRFEVGGDGVVVYIGWD